MRYGLEIAAAGEGGDPRILAELARVAEAAGWDGVFLDDYIVHWDPDLPTYDPWVALAAIALATDLVRLGTTVTLLPRRPWKVAREAVTLDYLSGGRLVLGVGSGGPDDAANFDRFGEATDAKERAAMLDEGIEILAGLWSGEPFAYRGEHYVVDRVTFLPRPVQSPRTPIWVGGSSRRQRVVRRAARCDGIVPLPVETAGGGRHLTPAEVRDLKGAIAGHRAVTDPFDIALGGLARAPDQERERAHIEAVAEAGATWWLEWVPAADPATMRAAIERGPLRVA